MKIHHSPGLTLPAIAHGFFGREGGVSTGLYASLNCGPGSRDDPASVSENRARVVAALVPGAKLTTLKLATLAQCHGIDVHVATADWDETRHPPGDGLVTATPGVILGIQTADCAPVLLADSRARVIGAAHAGWKGALGSQERGGVLEATLAAMESLGARRADIAAAIGPCIAQADYEVGWDFRDRFLEDGLRNRKFFTPAGEGRYRFDLEAYAAHRLAAAGIAQVEKMGLSTYPDANGFFSFRRATHRGEPDYGREISAIVLTG